MDKIPYNGKYPRSAQQLFSAGIASRPTQRTRELRWAEGIDIVYTLKNVTPAVFKKYSETFLLLAYEEAQRYTHAKWKFASFDVKLGRLKKGKDLPEVASFPAAAHNDEEIMVWGPGYEVPQAKRYLGKVNKQTPYRVIRLVISVREEF